MAAPNTHNDATAGMQAAGYARDGSNPRHNALRLDRRATMAVQQSSGSAVLEAPRAVANTLVRGVSMADSTPSSVWVSREHECFGCSEESPHHNALGIRKTKLCDVVFTDSRTGRGFCHEHVLALASWEMDGCPDADDLPYADWIAQ